MRVSKHLDIIPASAGAWLVLAPTAARADPAPSGGGGATLLAHVADPPQPSTYTVRRGDTLSKVAEEECGDPDAWPSIAQANPAIKDPNLIHAGDVLELPDACRPGPSGAVDGGGVVHVVQEHESLRLIAQHYYGDGELTKLIFDANRNRVVDPHGERLELPRFIETGWRLVLPPVSGATGAEDCPAAGAGCLSAASSTDGRSGVPPDDPAVRGSGDAGGGRSSGGARQADPHAGAHADRRAKRTSRRRIASKEGRSDPAQAQPGPPDPALAGGGHLEASLGPATSVPTLNEQAAGPTISLLPAGDPGPKRLNRRCPGPWRRMCAPPTDMLIGGGQVPVKLLAR